MGEPGKCDGRRGEEKMGRRFATVIGRLQILAEALSACTNLELGRREMNRLRILSAKRNDNCE
jgi:hypothetical protein